MNLFGMPAGKRGVQSEHGGSVCMGKCKSRVPFVEGACLAFLDFLREGSRSLMYTHTIAWLEWCSDICLDRLSWYTGS